MQIIWNTKLLIAALLISSFGCSNKPVTKWKNMVYAQIKTEMKNSFYEYELTIDNGSLRAVNNSKSIQLVDNDTEGLQAQSLLLYQMIKKNAINRFDTITTNRGVRITVMDLIALPGNYAFLSDSERLSAIEKITNKRQLVNNSLVRQGALDFFENFYPSYFYEGKIKFPTWLTLNIVKLADWDVLKLFNNTFFWKIIIKDGYEHLLLFHADTKTLITLASDSTTDCQRNVDDPLAYEPINAVIRAIFFCLTDHNDSDSESFVYTYQIQIQEFLRSILKKDTETQKHKTLSSITYVPNNSSISKRFLVPFDQDIRIVSVGQVVQDKTPTKRIYGRDFIEVSFYGKEEIDEDERSIRFYYSRNDSIRQHTDQMDVYYSFEDNQHLGYVLKTAIPWTYIDVIPNEGLSFLMNIAVSDSDADPAKTESRIEWFKSKSQLMPLVLNNSWQINVDSAQYHNNTFQCLTNCKRNIYWSGLEKKTIAQLTFGERQSEHDNAASFKLLWDKEYLYLMVNVSDQVKQHPGFITTDYAQIIEEDNNELIWQAVGRKMDNFPEYIDSATINFKAGSYLLKYISNHSYAIDDMVPSYSGYGITLKNVIP